MTTPPPYPSPDELLEQLAGDVLSQLHRAGVVGRYTEAVTRWERALLRAALRKTHGAVHLAAVLLGLKERTMFNMLRTRGVSRDPFRRPPKTPRHMRVRARPAAQGEASHG